VHADGTLNVLDRESGKDEEIRKLPQERVRPLVETLSRPEWQEVESSYGEPQVFYLVVEGGDKRTVIELPSEIGSHSPVVPYHGFSKRCWSSWRRSGGQRSTQ
jgi:hypothetical protein